MTQYRLLERLNDLQEWEPAGVAFMRDDRCLLYLGVPGPMFNQPVHLTALGELHLPVDGDIRYRWSNNVEAWDRPEPFDPDVVLRSTQKTALPVEEGDVYNTIDDAPREYRIAVTAILEDRSQLQNRNQYIRRVMRDFVASYIKDSPPPAEFVHVLWRYWTYETQRPPLPHEEHNVALLLYARAYGFPVDDHPDQIDYLHNHKSLYASLASTPIRWGARASLSKQTGAALDAPVMHVWVLKNQENVERVIIAGRGLPRHQEKIFSDALITAMRVRASEWDLVNAGLMDIRGTEQTAALDVQLPVLGDNAPLAERETVEGALGELIKQLRELSEKTGFVQVHEADAKHTQFVETTFWRNLANEVVESPVLWAPDAKMMDSAEELVAVVPVYTFKRRDASDRARAGRLTLSLPLPLLATEAWERLYNAYTEHLIRRIELDARIRRDFYNKEAHALRGRKERWDKADEQMREGWGPTQTLNSRFEEKTGLIIWLQPPKTIPTKEYFEKNVPNLILGYESWATKMQKILDVLREAAERPDVPFRRFITTRLFDSILRERPIQFSIPRIQKLYAQWSAPAADLLRFLWRKKLRPLGKPEDLLSPHTIFQTVFFTNDKRNAITELLMVPHLFFDAKRSVVLLDPKRGFMTIKNAADYAKEVAPKTDPENIPDILGRHGFLDQMTLTEELHQTLINNPQGATEQILALLRPQVSNEMLIEDSNRVNSLKNAGLEHAKFPRHLNLAASAMNNRALITARQALEEARAAIPKLTKQWEQIMVEADEERSPTSLRLLPNQNELECRLYLLMAIAECLATDQLVKDVLPSIYRAPHSGKRAEIYDALAAADKADRKFTSDWIETLAQWDLNIAYNKLIRDLPGEEHLSSLEEYSATRLFEAIELVQIAKTLREATAALSHTKETQASALVKLVPAMEQAILSPAAGNVRGDLEYLLELLTGRQVGFERDRG